MLPFFFGCCLIVLSSEVLTVFSIIFNVQIFSKIPNYSSDPESVSRQQNATKQNKKDQVKERESNASARFNWKRQAITWNYSQRDGGKKERKKNTLQPW